MESAQKILDLTEEDSETQNSESVSYMDLTMDFSMFDLGLGF